MTWRRLLAGVLLTLGLLAAGPAMASAQGFGIGPRFSFVRGDIASDAQSTRFLGGTIRMSASSTAVTELAMDYRTFRSEDFTTQVRETPIQGSLLIFFGHHGFSPYLLGGFGIYTRQYDQLDKSGKIIDTTTERRTGLHLGAGAEIRLSRHTAVYGDYRLRFVKFGAASADGQPVNIPGLSKLKLSHQGSMWTGGVAFYF